MRSTGLKIAKDKYMLIGEVLGNVDCTVKNEELQGLKLKVVRLYSDGRPDRVVVAGDSSVAPGSRCYWSDFRSDGTY